MAKNSPPNSTDPLVTREGIRVEVGQIWQDLDPRCAHRRRRIVSVDAERGKVTFEGPMRTTVSVRRMYRHSTSWKLVDA